MNSPEVQKKMISEINSFRLPLVLTLFVYSLYVHILIYLYFSWKELKKYRDVVKENYSELSKLNLRWLKFMINSLVILVLIALFQSVLPYTFGKTYIYIVLIALILFVFYFINHVILKALNYPRLFSGIGKDEKEIKYVGSTLTENEREKYKTALMNYIETEKPFLIPELNINDLAVSLNVSSKKLSQVINQSFNKSFFDFINSYRINEVKKKLKENSDNKITILEIMYDSGFNSKSSFNTCFKRMTSMTPSEYKKSIKIN